MKNKTVLIVVAHPDDEILGCGGTVARLIKEGYDAYTLILSEGKTSRGDAVSKSDIALLRKEAISGNNVLGISEVTFDKFPDNSFDSVPLIDIVRSVNYVKEQINPGIIFTHYSNDLNIDHRITCSAVVTATRPMTSECVKAIYSFEVLSSTEWNYPLSFSPNVFYNINETMSVKLKAMESYNSELREYPHPRSLRAMEENARVWGFKSGIGGFVEAFQLVRKIV